MCERQKMAKLASRFWSPYGSSANRGFILLHYKPSGQKWQKKLARQGLGEAGY